MTITNRDATTASDNNYGLWIVKGSTTSNTTQKFVRFSTDQGSANSGTINANGADTAAFGSTSDIRLKQSIVDCEPVLDRILNLRPVSFDFISKPGQRQWGFIAQEFELIFPKDVSEDVEGYKSITGWGPQMAYLVKAIQELKALVDTQTAELDAAKAEIEILKAG